HVQPSDLDTFMNYQNLKFYKLAYQPRPFCFPVRRLGHVPEGVVSIETVDKTAIQTTYSRSTSDDPMYFNLDASTKVTFNGNRYLHGYLTSRFSESPALQLNLVARARQFSSFIVMIGTLASKDVFAPKHAIIVQNKDQFIIPLLTEMIPSAKAFKDAISSLSPEQQRFAKAFRSMQLESSLFCMTIVQIKPQLEKVLNLPPDALTKEIQLTQDLMKLFVEYQIPSDLLSFDQEVEYDTVVPISTKEKVDRVRTNAAAMNQMIVSEKESELKSSWQETEKAALSSMQTDYAYPSASLSLQSAMPAVKAKKSGMPMMARMSFGSSPGAMPPPPPAPCAAPATIAPKKLMREAPVPQPASSTTASQSRLATDDDRQATGILTCSTESTVRNYSTVPALIDSKFEVYDKKGAVRPIILTAGTNWNKKYFKGLLGQEENAYQSANDIASNKNKAFDLLDALTKSGALSLEADLHILIGVAHTFDKTVMDTIVQENTNPIEKINASTVVLTACIHDTTFQEVVAPSYQAEIEQFASHLLES
ncbi:hypothetical protein HDU91_000535, partial [Kappamyces sp. JEL0680]